MDNMHFLVTISCMTYNQSNYICECLDGFVMQKTNFPFVAVVVDDASTDGETTVLRQYMDDNFDMNDADIAYVKETDYAHILFARHKTNKNCHFAVLLLKENHYKQHKSKNDYLTPWRDNIKYRAFCEGDDFWVDSLKLQRQVDYLEAHPDVSLSCTRCNLYYQDTGKTEIQPNYYFDGGTYIDKEDYVFTRHDAYTKGWITQTLTMVVRNDLFNKIDAKAYKYYRDTHFIFYILSHGKAVCHNFIGGTYRINRGGVYGSLDESQKYRMNLLVFEELYENNRVEELAFNIKKNYKLLLKYDKVIKPKNIIETKLLFSYSLHNFPHFLNLMIGQLRVKLAIRKRFDKFIK